LDGAQPTSVPPDLWSLWPKLKGIPMLALRGALSDIISPDILSAMVAAHPNLKAVTVPNRGHAPMLDEPVAVAAIDAFLAGLA
jgi:pimeloyl-ACP methyl ester carboxylesterase